MESMTKIYCTIQKANHEKFVQNLSKNNREEVHFLKKLLAGRQHLF